MLTDCKGISDILISKAVYQHLFAKHMNNFFLTSTLLSKRITAYFKNKFQHFQKYFFKAAFIKPIQTGLKSSIR